MAQPMAVAVHAVRRAAPEPGTWMALIGVGGIGSFVLATLQAQGFGPVVAVDISGARLSLASRLGAAHVVNAARQDPLQVIRDLTGGAGVHLAIEASPPPVCHLLSRPSAGAAVSCSWAFRQSPGRSICTAR